MIGIDPGLLHTGYGVLEKRPGYPEIVECGVIKTRSDNALPLRLSKIFWEVRGLLQRLQPNEMAVEDLHSRARFVKMAILMGHARGVVVMAAGDAGIPVFNYQPTQAKNVITGSGRADKLQMMKTISAHLKDERAGSDEHIADALALALCHLLRTSVPVSASITNR